MSTENTEKLLELFKVLSAREVGLEVLEKIYQMDYKDLAERRSVLEKLFNVGMNILIALKTPLFIQNFFKRKKDYIVERMLVLWLDKYQNDSIKDFLNREGIEV